MLGSILTQVFIGAALNDGEERLTITVEGFRLVKTLHASLQPSLGKLQTISSILVVALAWRTLVEGHHDIGSDGTLGIHHILRREEVFRAINVTTELTTFVAEFADARERENLKTTRVSKDRAIPGVELMEATRLAENIESGTEIEVVGVAQDDLGLYLLTEFREMHTLHTAHRTHRHEDGGENLSVVGGNHTCTGIRGIVAMFYFESHLSFFSLSSSLMVRSRGFFTISLVRAKFHTSCTFST